MKGKIDIINEFETEAECDYSYKNIASTKDSKIKFYRSKSTYNPYKTYCVSNKVYIVARCSQKNMKNIINSKLDKNQYYVKGKNVYLIYTEKDFDEIEANKMKEYVKFPLYLDYYKITQHIFDDNIDKNIENRINSILNENKATKKEYINTNNNNENIQIDNKNIFNTNEKNKTLKKDIHNNNFKEESKEEKKPENNNEIKSSNNSLNKNENNNININLNGEKTENNGTKYNKNNTSHNDDLKDKTAQQPYYQQVWNKVFGGCCPCGLDSTKKEQELKND